MTELHTDERWLKHRRQVKDGESAIKSVKGMYNDPQRPAELYGFWQTEPFRLKLTENGKIPFNKYGNIEIFNGPLPKECCYVNLPKTVTICRRLDIEFVQAVVGFEKNRSGSYPITKGVVIFKSDYAKVKAESAKVEEIMDKRRAERETKVAKKAWK